MRIIPEVRISEGQIIRPVLYFTWAEGESGAGSSLGDGPLTPAGGVAGSPAVLLPFPAGPATRAPVRPIRPLYNPPAYTIKTSCKLLIHNV